MAERRLRIAAQFAEMEDRWQKMDARRDANFSKIMAKLEILLQCYNCSPSSSHGVLNSPSDIPASELNLLVQDEIHSSAKQIKEDLEIESPQLVQGGSVDEQPTMVEEGISDFNQHSSSLEVADLEIGDSIEDSLVQSQIPTKTPFNNVHHPLFLEHENSDEENKIQPLITGLVSEVAGEQQDLTVVRKDQNLLFDFDFSFLVSDAVRSSCFALATYSLSFVVPSTQMTVNTISTALPQHRVALFDPGGKFNALQLWITNQIPAPPPKPPDQSCYSVFIPCYVQVLSQIPYLLRYGSHFNFYTFSIASSIYLHKLCLESHVDGLACYRNEWESGIYCDSQCLIYLTNFYANAGVYSAQKVFAEMLEQSVVTWLTFIKGFFTSITYGWEVYTSLSLDLCKTYAFSDASKYCIFSDYSQTWLQVTELICNELQQVLFLKQLGCNQSNHVKSHSSTKYTTVQIIQLIAIEVTGTFITIPLLLKFTSDMNLKYKEGLLNPLLTYDVGSYLLIQNPFTHVFPWCGFVMRVYEHFVVSMACEFKWLLIEIEGNNFSIELVTLVLSNSVCSKLKEVDDNKYFDRYSTLGLVEPYFLVKNTLTDMVAACGGINTIGVFHIGLGMAIKPSVTLGRSTWAALNLICNVIFNSIVVDDNECEKATWLKIGISSKLIVNIDFDLEDKITFRGVGNDMIYVVLVSFFMTNMLYNEETIGNNRDVEVEKLRKSRHMRINRLWCCYNNDNNRFLVYEFIPNGNLMGTMNGKKSLLDCHYNYDQPIAINVAKGLAYHNYLCEGKVAGTGASKIVPFVSKVVVFMYVTPGSYDYATLVRRRERKEWDPGGRGNIHPTTWSSKFKQWDPGIICARSDFHNLEDKVDFKGEGIVMSLSN